MTNVPVRVAVDLLGGDGAPDCVVDGALLAVRRRPDIAITLVGPQQLAEAVLADRAAVGTVDVVHANDVVGMAEDPAPAVRAKPEATVRVGAAMVRDGTADALVTVGSTGAAVAAASFTLPRLPGVTRPALAVVIPAAAGPLVLLDAGATVEATPDQLAQFALAGAAFARAQLGMTRPRVGLLSVGSEPGKGDVVRKQAYDALAAALDGLPVDFVGNVEGGSVPLGGLADVVVTDGFTGNVLLKGVEGTLAMVQAVVRSAVDADHPASAVLAEAIRSVDPDGHGGAVLLGVDGVVVVGHGAASAEAVCACIVLAASAAGGGLVAQVRTALGELLARRRAGLQMSDDVQVRA